MKAREINLRGYSSALCVAAFMIATIPCSRCLAETTISPGGVITLPIDSSAKIVDAEARVSLSGIRQVNGIGKQHWQLEWCDSVTGEVNASFTVQWGNESFGDIFDRRFMRVSYNSADTCVSVDVSDGVNLYGGYNTLSLRADASGTQVWAGDNEEVFVGTFPAVAPSNVLRLSGNRKMKVAWFAVECEPDKAKALLTDITDLDSLSEYFAASNDPLEGIWSYLDRDTDDRRAVPGGNYTFAIVRHDDSHPRMAAGKIVYDIIYAGGAKVNSREWKPGMLKGHLLATRFENHFDVVWIDSMMEVMDDELSVDFTPPLILSFEFPIYHARLRFAKQH